MRIAMIGSRGLRSNYGGIERVLDDLCPRLRDLGHSVDVYSRSDLAFDDGAGLRSIAVRSFGGKHLETLTRSVFATAMALRRHDVIHFHAVGPGLCSIATRVLGHRSVVTIHGLDHQREKWGPFAKFGLRCAERALTLFSDDVTVVSASLGRYIRERYDRRAVFIPNGLPMIEPAPAGPFLQRHGLSPGEYFLFASRLTPEKGCHDLIAAFNGLDTGRKLAIAGGVGPKDYLEGLRRIADPSKVVFLGHLHGVELREIFSNAFLFVLPSFIEGMSMALLEAISHGLPVLASDIEENTAVLGSGGYRFPPGDVDCLRQRLAELDADPGGVAASASALSSAKRRNWEDVALEYHRLYSRLLNRTNAVSSQKFRMEAA